MIIKFSAEWCLNCKLLTKYLNIKNIITEDIDYDDDISKVELYNIKKLPTLIILNNDIEIDRFEGYSEKRNNELYNFLEKNNIIKKLEISENF